jgi:hypothetical protein
MKLKADVVSNKTQFFHTLFLIEKREVFEDIKVNYFLSHILQIHESWKFCKHVVSNHHDNRRR